MERRENIYACQPDANQHANMFGIEIPQDKQK